MPYLRNDRGRSWRAQEGLKRFRSHRRFCFGEYPARVIRVVLHVGRKRPNEVDAALVQSWLTC